MAACAALHTAAIVHGQMRTIHVDDDAPRGGDGQNWARAFRDLQDALDAARGSIDFVEIRVGQGEYLPDRRTLDRALSFDMDAPAVGSGVTLWLRGGFAGYGASNPDEQDPAAFVSVLSGDLKGDDGPGFSHRADNAYHVVRIAPQMISGVQLEGLTIRGGEAVGAPQPRGGGVFVPDVLGGQFRPGPILKSCRVVDNRAAWGGGGVYVNWCQAYFIDTVFSGNDGGSAGGAVGSAGASWLVFDRCRIEGNTAGRGGGVFAEASVGATLMRSTIAGNTATATGEYYGGGGVYTVSSTLLLNCRLTANRSRGPGAAVAFDGGPGLRSFAMVNCTVTHNSSDAAGGAAVVRAGVRSSILNSVLWSNTSPGAIALSGAMLRVDRCIVEGGSVAAAGGAVVQYGSNFAVAPGFADPLGPDGVASTWEDNDERPAPFSPCIDAGSNVFLPIGGPDLLGQPRFADDPWVPDTGAGGGIGGQRIVDLGAYERQGSSCPADCNADLVLTVADFACFQSHFTAGHAGADCNGDGSLSVADFGCFRMKFVTGCP